MREAITLASQGNFRVDHVSAVRLTLPPAEAAYPGTDSRGPFTDIGATLMSSQFCLAVALTQRRLIGSDLKRLNDPSLKDLIDKIEVHANPGLQPRSFVLEVDLADGQTVTRSFTPTGQPFNWERAEVTGQLQSMVDELPIGTEGLDHLCQVVLSAENQTVQQIVDACCTGIAHV